MQIHASRWQRTLQFMEKYDYRPALAIFLAIFAVAALYRLGYMSVQWDEVSHLNSAIYLKEGQYWYFLNNSFYPPLFDAAVTGFFEVFGVSLVSGRLAAVAFALLSIWAVFELANAMYGKKAALLSAVFLGVMPGFFWLSRIALVETMLVFFFVLSMLFFYRWLQTKQYRMLFFSGLALGFGFLAKYQIIAAGIAMVACLLVLGWRQLKRLTLRFPILIVTALIIIIPWILIAYSFYSTHLLNDWLYALQMGNPGRSLYSERFPLQIFYLLEMTWPYGNVHPVSVFLYGAGLLGLGLFAYRRKRQDLFLIIWFVVVFVFFTAISNRQWRYVTPLFPVLAVSAAGFFIFVYGKISRWKPKPIGIRLTGRRLKVLAVALFAVLTLSMIVYSCNDAYQLTAKDQIYIPIEEASNYLAGHLEANQTAVLVCAFNLLNQDMFRFYLPSNMKEQVWQYPDAAVDAFTPNFNTTEFVNLCQERNVKYIILFDYGIYTKFFNSTLDYTQVETMIYNTGLFGDPQDQPFWGDFYGNMGYRIFLVRFMG
jgi:4-amino-4-deoxy-L-arabinose transferase-like glycosyltransferase